MGTVNPFAGIEVVSAAQNRSQRAAVIGAIKAFGDLPAPISSDQIGYLMAFENRLYPILQEDKRWYFANAASVEGMQFARDLQVLHSYAAQMLEQLVTRRGEWSHGDKDALLQQVICFALYHHGASVKWSFFRHEPTKLTVWPDLHGLYQFAETHGFATSRVTLFDIDAAYEITPLSLYLRTLLMDVLNTGGLTTGQIEIADGWMAEWTPEYLLDTDYSPRSHALFVDLTAMAGLQVMTGTPTRRSHRFLRVDGVREQIKAVRAALRAGQAYAGRNAIDVFPIEEHVALLATIERLYQTLLHASASRIEERTPVVNVHAEVRLGFDEARRVLAGNAESPSSVKLDNLDLSLESEPAVTAERDARWTRWKVHDMSSRGMGLMVDRVTGERIAVGQLLAIKPDGFSHWMLGVIVRKLTQRALGETLLGVEVLSYRPLALILHRYTDAHDTTPDATLSPVAAIYLPAQEADGKADMLALPAGDYGLKNVFALPAGMGNFRVRINRVLRKGGDWVGLRFEVIGKR